MTFTIHRGANEIGGSCVEVCTETTRLVLDIGMPLVNPDKTPFDTKEIESLSADELVKKGILPNIPSLYQDNSKTAVLISHSHQDHYGLINYINPSCPVYIGAVTQLMIETLNLFTNKNWSIKKPRRFEHGKKFKIGDIEITPYLMDHSAFDSYAFLIEADRKSLLYSGDFRLHSRNDNSFNYFRENIRKEIDYMFLEGSTLGRPDTKYPSETELEEQFIETFKQTKGINLIFTSGQNIERLTTIYNACTQCGKIFLIDFYTANILKMVHNKGNKNTPFASSSFPEIKIYYPTRLTDRMMKKKKQKELIFPFVKYKIGKDKIKDMIEKLVMLVRPGMQFDLERYLHNYTNGCFIYSLWKGYIYQNSRTKEFMDFIENKGIPVKYIHTSGHADLDGLKKIVGIVKPKNIVPIHTYESEKYPDLFNGNNIFKAEDKEKYQA